MSSLGPVMCGLSGQVLSRADRTRIRSRKVGGVVLFARNYESAEQLRELVREIRSLRRAPLLLAVDHEGGRVQRFQAPFTRLPAAACLGERFDADPLAGWELARAVGMVQGIELARVGIDVVFAPVVDLAGENSATIGARAIHSSPETVALLAGAQIRALRAQGVVPVAKHFPGHGGVDGDTHRTAVGDARSFSEIWARDLVPYRTLIGEGLEAVMSTHVRFPSVSAEPATYSEFWLKHVLRDRLGFAGASFSDDLVMSAASEAGSVGARVQAALCAGCDAALVCNALEELDDWLALATKADAGASGKLAQLARRRLPGHSKRAGRSRALDAARSVIARLGD